MIMLYNNIRYVYHGIYTMAWTSLSIRHSFHMIWKLIMSWQWASIEIYRDSWLFNTTCVSAFFDWYSYSTVLNILWTIWNMQINYLLFSSRAYFLMSSTCTRVQIIQLHSTMISYQTYVFLIMLACERVFQLSVQLRPFIFFATFQLVWHYPIIKWCC
jgi:hypothetical protein